MKLEFEGKENYKLKNYYFGTNMLIFLDKNGNGYFSAGVYPETNISNVKKWLFSQIVVGLKI
jgi:hypothetical protein